VAVLLFSCTFLFQNCSPVGFDKTSGVVALDSTAGSSGTSGSDGSSGSGTTTSGGGVTTGNTGIDGQTAPILTNIGSVDSDFDRSNVYYVKFDLLENLLTNLVQIVYAPSPQSCQVTWDWTLLALSFKGNHDLNLNACGGFEMAAQVAAKQSSGTCTARVADSKTFGFAPVIDFVRTTEIDSDCVCFRRYVLDIFY
jgi:hypothetical protein